MKKENIGVIVSFVVVVAFIGLIVFILMNKAPKENPLEGMNVGTTEQPSADANAAGQAPQANPTTSTNETPTNTNTNNMDKVAKNGDTLVMNYTGRLTNGTVFDSNVDPKFGHVTPFKFKLGAGQVIKGWDEGLLGMKVGEKKTLTIPPEKGYGSQAVSTIPANSTLIFDVELVGIE